MAMHFLIANTFPLNFYVEVCPYFEEPLYDKGSEFKELGILVILRRFLCNILANYTILVVVSIIIVAVLVNILTFVLCIVV